MTQNTQPTAAQSQSLAVLERIAAAQEATEQKLDVLIELIKHMADAVNANTSELLFLKRQQDAQPQPSRAADVVAPVWGTPSPEMCEQFVAATISYEFANGKPQYKAKGGKFSKFGVPIYPEMLQQLGLEPEQLKFGENPFGKQVIALIKNQKPQKIIGLGQ